jgi:peptidoglycan/xylan/chitin deacetylase (PgdA/CDA1 family)
VNAVFVLHPVSGAPGSRLATLLGEGLQPVAPLRGVNGCFERILGKVTGSETALAAAASGLPGGAALPEAIAVRLRRSGAELRWGMPLVVSNVAGLLELSRARGRSSVELARADKSLVPELQLGAWFDALWRMRAIRRVALGLHYGEWMPPTHLSRRWLSVAADIAFWTGVTECASAAELRRLTTSSYAALVYHRFSGEQKPGQERIDIAPNRFDRQLWALTLARYRPLRAEQILDFHADATGQLPRRSFAITVDDAISDCVGPLLRHARFAPQLFVCTRELGGRARWIDGEPVATWSDVSGLASAGVAIGSHARMHRRLTALSEAERTAELAGSLADLRERIGNPIEVVAFPHGDHDGGVCRAAREAGFRAAYTTEKGRNGAGTDPLSLRRVSVHAHDGVLAVLWKVLTGEALPAPWLKLRALRQLISR